ncbi:hypothetical protein CcrColossus_gp321 [Caulobacter phage CcrColossus]|uniref:Uncharacterized protein n=1 Tax=Caulobacter phage CcrColossus TaxID=1211640 RepID=K4JSS8_9CAUD|nr:hypothetical protein CcrColossus_gp321 [Caulobacter phage CcrColossus]AFU88191.1 hypothetical protein CcrColossus_gp321 [Caulobacter phage CcrColossus]
MRKLISKFSDAYNAYRDARTPRYVGHVRLPYTAYNPFIGLYQGGEDFIHFYRTPKGKRSVKVTDRRLMQRPLVQAYLRNGTLPLAA